jgi:serine/threonine-protein kinase HipA
MAKLAERAYSRYSREAAALLGMMVQKARIEREMTVAEVILCGNTDDHARNHAAFWDGRRLSLTPAYDICPQIRAGNEASQAMLITDEDRMSTLANCLRAAPHFLIGEGEAREIVTRQIATLRENWDAVCEEAALTEIERNLLAGRAFLNPYIFEGEPFA